MYYDVCHVSQCEGITAKHADEVTFPDEASNVEHAQNIIYDYLGCEGVKLVPQEGGRAFYRPSTDENVLPLRMQFVSTAEYNSMMIRRS